MNDGPEGPGGSVPERHEGFLRPRFEILGEESLVPDANLVRPAPDRFTHELVRSEPYYYRRGEAPAGQLPAGTRVVLMEDDGTGRCRVVDGRGLYVEVAGDGLRKLPES